MTKRETQTLLAALVVTVLGNVFFHATEMALASRNASGTYSLPTGNPVVTGTAISSTVHNNTMSDLATEMTDSLNRSGKGAMLAGLPGYVGTVSLPGYTFSGDLNTGLYWVSADTVGLSAGGTKVASWGTGGIAFGASGTAIDNSVATASTSVDFAGVTDSCEDSGAITVTGADIGDVCTLGYPDQALPSSTSWVLCYVSDDDAVKIRHCAHGATGNVAPLNFSIRVFDP